MSEEKTTRHPGGRPREFDGPPVRVRLPAALHDDLCREAIRRQVDVSDVVRDRLARGSVVRNSKTK